MLHRAATASAVRSVVLAIRESIAKKWPKRRSTLFALNPQLPFLDARHSLVHASARSGDAKLRIRLKIAA